MRQFKTALREATEPEAKIEFEIDGQQVFAFPPDPAQMAVLISGFGRHSSNAEQIATFIDFFAAVLDKDSASYVVQRLLDRDDPFGLDELSEVGEWLIEEWGGFPTPQSSGSSQSRSTGSRSSKPPTTKKTSSRSRSASS